MSLSWSWTPCTDWRKLPPNLCSHLQRGACSGAGNAQHSSDLRQSAGQAWVLPLASSVLFRSSRPECDLWSLDACAVLVAIEADTSEPVAITGGLLATRWNPSHACPLKISLPAPFRNLWSSRDSSFVGFTLLGLFVLDRLHGIIAVLFSETPGQQPEGELPKGKRLQTAARHGVLKLISQNRHSKRKL